MKRHKPKNNLTNYLALTLSSGVAATSAEGATIVTLYGAGVTAPAGINVGSDINGKFYADRLNTLDSHFGGITGQIFTRGGDLVSNSVSTKAKYADTENLVLGAVSGRRNYANISFDGSDSIYESVGQFHFDGSGGGYLIALATNDDGSALSISAGKIAIDIVSPVPEPSGHLALLALGSAGLLIRRRIKRAG